MDERTTKRDLVLAPSEYAYMQDVTKGIVKTYTGPTVINPTAQERPVVFDATKKLFEPCTLEEAVQQIAIAPEGYYVILKNPAQKADHPPAGGVYPAPDLDVVARSTSPGRCAFALWPGQIVQLVQGPSPALEPVLVVRVYNEDEARTNWGQAVIKATEPGVAAVALPADPAGRQAARDQGHRRLVLHPPTGGNRLSCSTSKASGCATRSRSSVSSTILVDQNGKKRFERGPQVVFPEPTETFIAQGGARKFRAIELNEIQGLHVKVIAPYTEAGRTYREGDELFITGVETAIYFPREEHSLVRYDGHDRHFAVAVPRGKRAT